MLINEIVILTCDPGLSGIMEGSVKAMRFIID